MSKCIIDRIGPEEIIRICNSSENMSDAALTLQCGFRYLKKAAIKLGCWKSNPKLRHIVKFVPSNSKAYNVIEYDRQWLAEVFAGNYFPASTKLKHHLLRSKTKDNKCELCGITEWNSNPISLQLHHIDGNPKNNKLENLQILCPNCHTQTDNYGSKNAKLRS